MSRWTRRFGLCALAFFLVGTWAGAASAQYCVRYARSISTVDIMGDAWTWWDGSVGQYARGSQPTEGAVMVFRRSRGMPLGHVSAVTAVVDSRTILVDHSFGGPVLWRDMPIVDTSEANDWSQVRVWHGPSNQLGSTNFPIYGFVYPASRPAETPTTVAAIAAATTGNDAIAVLRTAAHSASAAGVVHMSATAPRPPRRPVDAAGASTVNLFGDPSQTDTAQTDPAETDPAQTGPVSGWTSPDVVDSVLSSYVPRRPPRGDASPVDPTVHVRRN